MEQKLLLSVFMLLIQVSVAVWQHVTVKKGQTVDLKCPITNAHNIAMEWKNPEGHVMFFKPDKVPVGVRNKRYSLKKLSDTEFTVSISDVTFKDGGNYTCSQYDRHATDSTVEVTVLGRPRMKTTMHDGRVHIMCTAEGNHHPPQISWKFDHGPEIVADSQVLREDNKYVSKALLHVQHVEHRTAVKCLVRHPALHAETLIDFVKIGPNSGADKMWGTTTTSSPTAQPQGSTEGPRTTTGWFTRGRTTVYLTSRRTWSSSETPSNVPTVPSSESKTVSAPTGFPVNRLTSSGSSLSASGWTSVPETTEEVTSYNHTEGNRTGNFNDPKMQTGNDGNSALLVFLVTCLIVCLLVVVIFFAIKLRRAHIAWKRENEESSDPSEESSKSKSSQEEKNSQGQRRRGVLNTAFTQYVTEDPPAITSVINTAAMASAHSVNTQHASQPQTLPQTSAKCDIKETEL